MSSRWQTTCTALSRTVRVKPSKFNRPGGIQLRCNKCHAKCPHSVSQFSAFSAPLVYIAYCSLRQYAISIRIGLFNSAVSPNSNRQCRRRCVWRISAIKIRFAIISRERPIASAERERSESWNSLCDQVTDSQWIRTNSSLD